MATPTDNLSEDIPKAPFKRRKASQQNSNFKTVASIEPQPPPPSSSLALYFYPQGPPHPLPGTDVLVNDPEFISGICLGWTDKDTDIFLESLPVRRNKRLPQSKIKNIYPEGEWIAESEKDVVTCSEKFSNRNLPDKRPKDLHNKIHLIKEEDWKDIVKLDQSCILMRIDDSGKDVGVFGIVIKDFLAGPGGPPIRAVNRT